MSSTTWKSLPPSARRHGDGTARAVDALVRGAYALATWRLAAPPTGDEQRRLEAAEVREMARRLQTSDPGFASDLFAAADRHETEGAG